VPASFQEFVMASVMDAVKALESMDSGAVLDAPVPVQQELVFVVRDPFPKPEVTDPQAAQVDREAAAREKALRAVIGYLITEFSEIDPEHPALQKPARFKVYQEAYRQALN
jgi:hypothetical protein